MCYTNRQYLNRLEKLDMLKQQIAELEKQAKAIEDDIKTDMGDVEKIECEQFRLSWSKIVSARFDTKAFHAEHEALYNQYTRNTETRRFSFALR